MEGLTHRPNRPSANTEETNYPKEKKAGLAKKDLKSAVVAVAIPLGLGVADAIFFNPNSSYYKELKKPSWNPPGWVFGAAWTVLYILMGLASWLVWEEGGFEKQAKPLGIYALQLVLNLLWPLIFFGLHNPGLALVDIIALLAAVVACLESFKRVSPVAANLLYPYLLWIIFATALNYKIYTLNA